MFICSEKVFNKKPPAAAAHHYRLYGHHVHVDVRTRRGRDLYEQHGVDAAVILRVVGHLRVLAPHHLAWSVKGSRMNAAE